MPTPSGLAIGLASPLSNQELPCHIGAATRLTLKRHHGPSLRPEYPAARALDARSAARCDLRQIKQRASVASRVECADTVVRSAAILPTFQRWKLVAISRSPGGTELASATSRLGRIHAGLEITELAVGSACAVVKAPVALNGRWRNSVGRSRRVVRFCGSADLDRAQEGSGGDHQETEWRAHKSLHFC